MCTLIGFIINFLQKKNKKASYYILLFVISGLIGVVLAVSFCYMMLFEQGGTYMP